MRHLYTNVTNLTVTPAGDGRYAVAFNQEDTPIEVDQSETPVSTTRDVEYYENVHGDLLAFHSNEKDSGPISMWSHDDDAWIGWDSEGSSRIRDDIRRYATPIQTTDVDIPLDR